MRALENRELVHFSPRVGWFIRAEGVIALDRFLQDNPHALSWGQTKTAASSIRI